MFWTFSSNWANESAKKLNCNYDSYTFTRTPVYATSTLKLKQFPSYTTIVSSYVPHFSIKLCQQILIGNSWTGNY